MGHRSVRIPLSTYRLQFNSAFTFQDAARIVPYLDELGITDCYSSPYLKAVPGSTHGYDVVDPTQLNPEVGSETDYEEFTAALHQFGMGQILDVVPNHMGIGQSSNPWWQDVLENGPSSRYASFFDIDWTPVKPELENRVLLPILGEQYGIVLENQEITLHYEDGQFFLRYYEHQLPLDPSTWPLILSFRQDILEAQLGGTSPHFQEFQSIITALTHLPTRNETESDRMIERYREKEVIRRRLSQVVEKDSLLQEFLETNVRQLQGTKGDPHTFDRLDEVVSQQAYRLAYWRVAGEEINYRRFFDVNELPAIRMERSDVFQKAQEKIFHLVQTGAVTGLRIDHVDGLYDPQGYLSQWQEWATQALDIPLDSQGRSLYLLVEKILGPGERLNAEWPVHGTTGYTFLSLVNQLFVESSHHRTMEQLYTRFTKRTLQYEDLVYQCKKLIMTSSMSGEINALGHELNVLSERNRRSRDFTLNNLIFAIREIIACFPVYRTYIHAKGDDPISERDRAYIRLSVARAKRRNPAMSNLVFDFIRDLLLRTHPETHESDWENIRPFVMQFQQTTSPVTAKGVEDTAFYQYNRLISLNEVGGEPQQFGNPLSTFHHYLSERMEQWPHSLSTTSTHDTKRGEDVRARINVLSEMPTEWRQHLRYWQRVNKKAKQRLDDHFVPSPNEEYLLYQTLLGTWPFENLTEQTLLPYQERLKQYFIKALREAKITTSWLNPDGDYEQGALSFLTHILSPSPKNRFLQDFHPFQRRIAHFGIYNSLSQVLIKTMAPGVPDFYQGTEGWNLDLVDPDNRQPIDFVRRQQALAELTSLQRSLPPVELPTTMLKHPENALIKLWMTQTTLRLRKTYPDLFLQGSYHSIEIQGEKAPHVCAFIRRHKTLTCLIAFPRFLTHLVPDSTQLPIGESIWGHTWLLLPPDFQAQRFRNVLTQQIVTPQIRLDVVGFPIGALFQHFPFAVMESVL